MAVIWQDLRDGGEYTLRHDDVLPQSSSGSVANVMLPSIRIGEMLGLAQPYEPIPWGSRAEGP